MLPIAVQILLLLLLLYAIILKLHEPILQPTFNVGCRIAISNQLVIKEKAITSKNSRSIFLTRFHAEGRQQELYEPESQP